MTQISETYPVELKARLGRGESLFILDVREPAEIAIASFPGATHIAMNDIPARIGELDPEREIIVVCHHGMRSAQVAMYLMRNGFKRVVNLSGGINAWSLEADPAVPRY
ncbi:MAG TPA: rhodanese-like domain-containing protein [Candidatus Binataceae bacterium]|nr:rhodanese-like domain-containing protein [Candidatus Binataceae bacterium]